MKTELTKWDVQDYLKTPEDRVAYIAAAAEEGTPDAIPDAFADVFRSMGMPAAGAVCDGLAVYLRAMTKAPTKLKRAKRVERGEASTPRAARGKAKRKAAMA